MIVLFYVKLKFYDNHLDIINMSKLKKLKINSNNIVKRIYRSTMDLHIMVNF